MSEKNRLIIISAPSGSGKSTIINWLMGHHELCLAFSISCTSRQPRGMERNGVEYFFVSEDEFRQRIEAGDFLEYEEVYPGRFYGTLREQVDKQLEQHNIIFDVDVKGGLNIKKHYGKRALSIFIQPPSIEELRERLTARGTDSAASVEQRIARAEREIKYADKFDRVIVNDDLAAAERQALDIVSSFLETKA